MKYFSQLNPAVVWALSMGLGLCSAQASVVISTFSNTAELGLGVQADYLYAVNFGTTTTPTIGGVTFNNRSDVTFTNGSTFTGTPPDFDGGGSAENNLENMMGSIRWDGGIGAPPFNVRLSGLTSGQLYELELLMWDPANLTATRTFDVTVNGSLILDDFELYSRGASSAGSAPNPDRGVNVSYVFNAPGTGIVDITYDRVGNSGVLSALTLAAIPEPSSVVLMILFGGLLAIAGFSARNR